MAQKENNVYAWRGAKAIFNRKNIDGAPHTTTFRYDARFYRAKTENGESPLEVYGHFSRFIFTIRQGGKTFTCNVDPTLYAELRQNTLWSAGLSNMSQLANNANSASTGAQVEIPAGVDKARPAFTVKMAMGTYKGKTPGDILMADPNQLDGLRRQKDFLYGHLSGPYEASNRKQISAIDDAIKMLSESDPKPEEKKGSGATEKTSAFFNLLKAPGSWTILNIPMLPNRHKPREDGKCPVHSLTIEWLFGQKYPVRITIAESWGDVIRKEDGTIRASHLIDRESASVNLSKQDWLNQVDSMQRNMHMFESINPESYFKEAEIADKKAYDTYKQEEAGKENTVPDEREQPKKSKVTPISNHSTVNLPDWLEDQA